MKMSLFVLAFIGVFILLHLYIYRRLVCKLDLHGKVKQSLTVFLIVNFVGIVLYMLARYYPLLPNWLYFLLSLPIGIVFLLFCTALVYDISSLAVRFTPMQRKGNPQRGEIERAFKKGAPFRLHRRKAHGKRGDVVNERGTKKQKNNPDRQREQKIEPVGKERVVACEHIQDNAYKVYDQKNGEALFYLGMEIEFANKTPIDIQMQEDKDPDKSEYEE